jgi:hypothetical protein
MKATYWGPAMTDVQCAVFHFDVKTMTMRDAQGLAAPDTYASVIFDSLEVAERYCQEKIASTRALGCRIYNHEGTVVGTFVDDAVYAQHHGQPAAKRSLWVGGACLAVGVTCIAVDAWSGWSLIFGVLLGLRFVWAGTMKLADGIAGTLENKRGSQAMGRE